MTPRHVERLRRILERMEAIETDAEEFARGEEDFLLDIARGTGNPLLIALYETIAGVRRQAYWSAHKRKALSPRRIRAYRSRYRSMFEAIERRDLETAVEYVKLQLVDEQRALMAEE
jgi:DNA-binding FadR family transcriptional regulator